MRSPSMLCNRATGGIAFNLIRSPSFASWALIACAISNLPGCATTKPSCPSAERDRHVNYTQIENSPRIVRRVCTIQGPEITTRSLVLGFEGNYLADVLKFWEAEQHSHLGSRVISSRSWKATRFGDTAQHRDRSDSVLNTPGENRASEDLASLKAFADKLERWHKPNERSDHDLANEANAFWAGNPNVIDSEKMDEILGQARSKILLNYLKARSVDNELTASDENRLLDGVSENRDQVQINRETVEKIREFIASPSPEREAVAVKGKFGKPADRLNSIFLSAMVYEYMRNPSFQKSTLKAIREIISGFEAPTLSSSSSSHENFPPEQTPPAVMLGSFFERRLEFVAVLRKANGLQYAAEMLDVLNSPIGGIHVDDGDVITLVQSSQLFSLGLEGAVSFQNIQNFGGDDGISNVAVIAMPLLGRLTEVLVPTSTTSTRSTDDAWIPSDAVISLQNYGQVPIISASRQLMERRLRGETDVILNEYNQICRLLPENSALANRLDPPSNRREAMDLSPVSAWNGWGVPSILR